MVLKVVKLDRNLVNDAEIYVKAQNYSTSQQIERWVRIGKIVHWVRLRMVAMMCFLNINIIFNSLSI